jgi:Ca2+-binding EF-hand superfamily protein
MATPVPDLYAQVSRLRAAEVGRHAFCHVHVQEADMRPRALTTALAIALPLTVAPLAHAQDDDQRARPRTSQSREAMRFQGMDTNRDGVITRREWRGSDTSFRTHDWNGDGVLSGDEVRVGASRPMNRTDDYTPSRAPAFYDWTQGGFDRLDTNRDGQIARSEWRNDYESFHRADQNGDNLLSRREFLNADTDTDREDRFDYLDANTNGRIERSEWHSSYDTFRWLDRNRDGVLSRTEVAGEGQTRETDRFDAIDSNGDGRITAGEWQWSQRSFDRYDRNGDGVLRRDEFTAADTAVGPVGTSGSNTIDVVVPPTQRWFDTGIDVRAGEVVNFQAAGTIRMSTGNDNDAASPAGAWSGRHADNAPFRDRPAGALIARIGNGSPLFLGERGQVNVRNTGRLYLSVNDDYLQDNSGEYRVTLTVR